MLAGAQSYETLPTRMLKEDHYCEQAIHIGVAYDGSSEEEDEDGSENPGRCAKMIQDFDNCSPKIFYFSPDTGDCYCASLTTHLDAWEECQEKIECSWFSCGNDWHIYEVDISREELASDILAKGEQGDIKVHLSGRAGGGPTRVNEIKEVGDGAGTDGERKSYKSGMATLEGEAAGNESSDASHIPITLVSLLIPVILAL